MSLKGQKRLAASLLKSGVSRVWVDPDETEKVRSAITRQEIQTLIKEGRIRLLRKKGISRGRIRTKKRRQRGSRKGGLGLGKTEWISRIRAVRRHLRRLRDSRQLSPQSYNTLLGMAKGGAFRNSSHIDEYVKARQLLRKR